MFEAQTCFPDNQLSVFVFWKTIQYMDQYFRCICNVPVPNVNFTVLVPHIWITGIFQIPYKNKTESQYFKSLLLGQGPPQQQFNFTYRERLGNIYCTLSCLSNYPSLPFSTSTTDSNSIVAKIDT